MPRLRRAFAAAAAALLTLITVPTGSVALAQPGQSRTIGASNADANSPVNRAGVYLEVTTPQNQRIACSGTLITEIHVLTAKHCVYNTMYKQNLFQEATAFIGLDRTNAEEIAVTKVTRSPSADLAILTLTEAADTTPAQVWGGTVNLDAPFVASGFGTGNNTTPLKRMGESYVNITNTGDYTLREVDATTQTGYFGQPLGNSRITQGDSGGALHNDGYVVAVNSAVYEDEGDFWMIFTPTQQHAAWIQSIAPGSVAGLVLEPSMSSLFATGSFFSPVDEQQHGVTGERVTA